jgi:hypothetical protein
MRACWTTLFAVVLASAVPNGLEDQHLLDEIYLTRTEVSHAEGNAKKDVAELQASEVEIDALHRKGDGENDSLTNTKELISKSGHQDPLAEQMEALNDADPEHVELLQEGAATKHGQYPWTISQHEAQRRVKRLHSIRRQIDRDKARERAHTPELTDKYRDPAVAGRLQAELAAFDKQNEKEHPELARARERAEKKHRQKLIRGQLAGRTKSARRTGDTIFERSLRSTERDDWGNSGPENPYFATTSF